MSDTHAEQEAARFDELAQAYAQLHTVLNRIRVIADHSEFVLLASALAVWAGQMHCYYTLRHKHWQEQAHPSMPITPSDYTT